jgi:hypothetical protein
VVDVGRVIAGLIMTIVTGFLALVLGAATVLSANPCGAFGDGCDDYGTTPVAFYVLLALTFLAIVLFVVGLVVAATGLRRRH